MPEETEKLEEEKKILRRAPAIPVPIAKLTGEMGRVAVIGTIISKKADIGSIVIDDGKASILVLLNDPADIERFKEGQTVRVLGKVWGTGDEIELQAEVVQDFSKIDRELYSKVMFG